MEDIIIYPGLQFKVLGTYEFLDSDGNFKSLDTGNLFGPAHNSTTKEEILRDIRNGYNILINYNPPKQIENWCIQGGEELENWIKDWEKENNKRADAYGKYKHYYYYPNNYENVGKKWHFKTGEVPDSKTVIDFKTFQQIINKEMTETKKIIGYLAPMDLFNGKVKKGTLYNMDKSSSGGSYQPVKAEDNKFTYYVAKEIVEASWEPIFSEQYAIGDYVIATGNISSYNNLLGTITKYDEDSDYDYNYRVDYSISNMDGNIWSKIVRKASKEEIEAANKIEIGGYKLETSGTDFNFGCQHFNEDDLVSFKKLINVPGISKITIGDTIIDEKLLNKIESKLK